MLISIHKNGSCVFNLYVPFLFESNFPNSSLVSGHSKIDSTKIAHIIPLNKNNPYVAYEKMTKDELIEFIDASVKITKVRAS